MRFGPHPVKHSTKQAQTAPNWSRWLEGWSLIFPSVGIAVLAAWLALPQGMMPDYLPVLLVPRAELEEAREQRTQDFVAAMRRPLAYEIRAIGEGIRQLGQLVHQGEA